MNSSPLVHEAASELPCQRLEISFESPPPCRESKKQERGKQINQAFCSVPLCRPLPFFSTSSQPPPSSHQKKPFFPFSPPHSQVEQLDAAGLEAAIASRDKPLIIDFFATWCGPCVLMAKELELVAAELGDAVKIVKVDVDAEEAVASSLSIQGLPTLVFVGTEPGKPALRTEGLLPAATIKEIIANEL